MAFLHKDSPYCKKSELDLFTVPPTQLSIDKHVTVEYRPTSPLTGNGPLEFQIDGCDDFTDLSNSYLYVKVQILTSDGKPLGENDVVGPANLFLHSLFSKIELKLNGRQVCSMNNYVYPCRAMLETLLSYGKGAKSSHLECELYYKDTAGAMEDMKEEGENEGFTERYGYCKESNTIDMIGRIHHDILLNKVDINLILTRLANEFCLLSETGKEYKVVYKEAVFLVDRVTASNQTSSAIEKTFEKGRAIYIVDNIRYKDITIPPGNCSLIEDKLLHFMVHIKQIHTILNT